MTKTLFLTLFAALFLIGGATQSYAHCGKCGSHAEMKAPCEKCMKADKPCKCKKTGVKPCEKKMDKKKPCSKCAEARAHYGMDKGDTNMRTGDEVRSNIGSLKMRSGIDNDSYND